MENYNDVNPKVWIDLKKDLPPQPIAISLGRSNNYPTPFGTYGNFSCITGPSKVGKSFFKQMLIAGYIGGDSVDYCDAIAGHNSAAKLVLDFDTEQSPWQVQRNGRNIVQMVNATASENYHTYALRELDSKTRLQFVEKTLELVSEKFKIGLVCIDGIADLMNDTNSLIETNEVMTKIMQWTTQYKLHLLTVVHLNFGDNPKPTGHIGSAITKKAETVAVLKSSDSDEGFGVVTVFPRYTRNVPFKPMAFTINNGKPMQTDVPF